MILWNIVSALIYLMKGKRHKIGIVKSARRIVRETSFSSSAQRCSNLDVSFLNLNGLKATNLVVKINSENLFCVTVAKDFNLPIYKSVCYKDHSNMCQIEWYQELVVPIILFTLN